jgi:hypothetical protein
MTETNPFPKFSRAWFAWNGRKGGRAGVGKSKARPFSRERSLAMLAKRKDRQPAETDPYSGT